MDTPSSEDNSPKSSFANKSAKIEIKPRLPKTELAASPTKDDAPATPTATTPTLQNPPLAGLPKRPPPPPPPPENFSTVAATSQKPPVPSRAGIDRKLQKSGLPPPPPVRSVSLLNGSVTPTKDDSGRDSDATENDLHHPAGADVIKMFSSSATATTIRRCRRIS
jgi:hypothetical protein